MWGSIHLRHHSHASSYREGSTEQIEEIDSKERLKVLEQSGGYLFHGTPFLLNIFEPKQAYTENVEGVAIPDGEPSVFASAEIETPIFRSIFHDSHFQGHEGDFQSGFSNSGDKKDYINASQSAIDVCRGKEGYVYVFKREGFIFRGNKEWVAYTPVYPVAVFRSAFDDIGLPIHLERPRDT